MLNSVKSLSMAWTLDIRVCSYTLFFSIILGVGFIRVADIPFHVVLNIPNYIFNLYNTRDKVN